MSMADTPTKSGLTATNTPQSAQSAQQQHEASGSSIARRLPGSSRPLLVLGSQQHTALSPADNGRHNLLSQWHLLHNSLKGHSQAAAELLMKQAASNAQLDQFVVHLISQLQTKDDERQSLEAQLRKDRAEFTGQARVLSQHFATAQHKSTALQVVHEALQAELRSTKEAWTRSQEETVTVTQELEECREQLSNTRQAMAELQAELSARQEQFTQQQQLCDEQRAIAKELRAAKSALQSQLSGMVAAERELTEHLKVTHQQIDEQLHSLREQLKEERQRRAAVTRKKTELQHQVTVLTNRLEHYLEKDEEGAPKGRDQSAGGSSGHMDVTMTKDQKARRQVSSVPAALRASANKPIIRLAIRHPTRGTTTLVRRPTTQSKPPSTARDPPPPQPLTSPPTTNVLPDLIPTGPTTYPAPTITPAATRKGAPAPLSAHRTPDMSASGPRPRTGPPPQASPASSSASHSGLSHPHPARSHSQYSLRGTAQHTPMTGATSSAAAPHHTTANRATPTPTSRTNNPTGQSAAGRPMRSLATTPASTSHTPYTPNTGPADIFTGADNAYTPPNNVPHAASPSVSSSASAPQRLDLITTPIALAALAAQPVSDPRHHAMDVRHHPGSNTTPHQVILHVPTTQSVLSYQHSAHDTCASPALSMHSSLGATPYSNPISHATHGVASPQLHAAETAMLGPHATMGHDHVALQGYGAAAQQALIGMPLTQQMHHHHHQGSMARGASPSLLASFVPPQQLSNGNNQQGTGLTSQLSAPVSQQVPADKEVQHLGGNNGGGGGGGAVDEHGAGSVVQAPLASSGGSWHTQPGSSGGGAGADPSVNAGTGVAQQGGGVDPYELQALHASLQRLQWQQYQYRQETQPQTQQQPAAPPAKSEAQLALHSAHQGSLRWDTQATDQAVELVDTRLVTGHDGPMVAAGGQVHLQQQQQQQLWHTAPISQVQGQQQVEQLLAGLRLLQQQVGQP